MTAAIVMTVIDERRGGVRCGVRPDPLQDVRFWSQKRTFNSAGVTGYVMFMDLSIFGQ